jgi:hypothetical protein
MTPLGVKTCGESEFDIFKAKKSFHDSGNACVLKRKVTKIAHPYCAVAPKFYNILNPVSLQKSGLMARTLDLKLGKSFRIQPGLELGSPGHLPSALPLCYRDLQLMPPFFY